MGDGGTEVQAAEVPSIESWGVEANRLGEVAKLRQGAAVPRLPCKVQVVEGSIVNGRCMVPPCLFRRTSYIRCALGQCPVVGRQESAIAVDGSGQASIGAVLAPRWTEANSGATGDGDGKGKRSTRGRRGSGVENGGISGGNGRTQGRHTAAAPRGQSAPETESGLQRGCRAGR